MRTKNLEEISINVIAIILIIGIVVMAFFAFKYTTGSLIKECKINDILQITSPSFTRSAICLYDTSCNKVTVEGCNKAVGDYVYKCCTDDICWYSEDDECKL